MGHTRTTLIAVSTAITMAVTMVVAPPAGADTELVETVELQPDGTELDVAFDPDTGRSVVVWETYGDLFAVMFDADGEQIAGPVTVAEPALGRDARNPEVARSDDAWLVAYATDDAPGNDGEYEIRTRYLTDDLQLGPGSLITPVMGDDIDERHPALAWVSENEQFLLVWRQTKPQGGQQSERIRARALTAGGAAVSVERHVISEDFFEAPSDRIGPPAVAVAADGSGALVAVHADYAGVGLPTGEFEVVARPVTLDGEVDGPAVRVSRLDTDGVPNNSFGVTSRAPAVAATGGGYVIGFIGDDGDGSRAHARVIDVEGAPLDVDEQVVIDHPAANKGIDLASDGSGGLIAATAGDQDGSDLTLVQRLAVDGSTLDPNGEIVEAGAATESPISVAGSTTGATVAFITGGISASVLTETTPVVVPPAADADGYWMVEADGSLHAFGDAPELPDVAPAPTSQVIDLDVTPSGAGLWALDSSGTVHALGDATDLGDAVGVLPAGESAIALAPTPSGDGYWIFSDAGRVLVFGDATHHGDLLALSLNGPVIDAVPTVTGDGYWMLGTDGGVFALGDATFHGSTGDMILNEPAVGLVPDPDGEGYWFVASDGGVFAFDADFLGSMGATPLNAPVVGMISYGDGYAMVATDGGAFVFSTEPFLGSLGSTTLDAPVTALTALG